MEENSFMNSVVHRHCLICAGWRPSTATPGQYVSEESSHTPRQPLQVAGKRTADECGVSAFAGKIAMHVQGNLIRSWQGRRREKGIVAGIHQKSRDRDAAKDGPRARARPVVVGVAESMQGRRDNLVEFTQRARAPHRLAVEESGKTLELALALFLHRGEKCASVDEIESAAQRIACRHEIDGGRYGGRRGEYVLRQPVLAEPLEKPIAAARHANREDPRAGWFIAQAP